MEPKEYPAPGSKTLAEILADLRIDVPERLISEKDTGTYKAKYLKHTVVRDLLDYLAPGWHSTLRIFDASGTIYVTCALTIVGSDGTITREGIGNEKDQLSSKEYGDPSSNSHAQALRRAAMEFGLGRSFWKR